MHTTEGVNTDQGVLETWPLDVSQVNGNGPRRSPTEDGAASAAAFAAGDVAIILAAGFLSYYLRAHWAGFTPLDLHQLPHLRLLGLLLCYVVFTVICNVAYGLYSGASLQPSQPSWPATLKSFVLSSLLTITVIFLVNEKSIPRTMVASTAVLSLVGALAFRHLARQRSRLRMERGMGTHHVLILGGGRIGDAFKQHVETQRHLGKVFCGFVSDAQSSRPEWLGTPADLPRILKECFIDEIYCTPEIGRDLIMDVAMLARKEHCSVKVVPDLYDGLALGADLAYIGNVPVLELNHQPIPAGGLLFKRFLDLALASVLLLAGAPVMLLAALAIALDSRGPILYGAWRLGRKGRKFRCYKFRTMVADADARKDEVRHMNERDGATFKIANDPRLTRVGRILRKYSIDEMPQLFNVLRGEMSMVGPRPHPVDDCNQYQLQDLRRLDVLPGITGLWQVTARRDPSFERNVALDLEYIDHWNVWLDLRILLRTVPEVVRGSGD